MTLHLTMQQLLPMFAVGCGPHLIVSAQGGAAYADHEHGLRSRQTAGYPDSQIVARQAQKLFVAEAALELRRCPNRVVCDVLQQAEALR